MPTGKRPNRQGPAGGYARRKLAPLIEAVEARQMLDAGFGFIAGSVFSDAARSGRIDPSDPGLAGVTVQLFRAGDTTTPVATAVTDQAGVYAFNGLSPGSYLVTETPPTGQGVLANRFVSDVYPAASVSPATVAVTVPDPSKVFLNYNGVNPANYLGLTDSINGTVSNDAVGALGISLGTAPGKTDLNPGLTTFCLDDLHRVPFEGGTSFPVTPRSLAALTNGNAPGTIPADRAGRIAYLFNHFGNASLTNVQAAGLQLAIWELLYDNGPTADFHSGNFQVVGAIDPSQQALANQAEVQAAAYFDQSAGKGEPGVYLQATSALDGTTTDGFQSMVARGRFDFLNGPTPGVGDKQTPPSSLSGFVYCDDNNNGLKEAGESGIAGSVVTLTGADGQGNPVRLATTTDANGFYLFANLQAGTYTLTQDQPGGFLDGKDTQGTPGNGVVGGDVIANIRLAAGVNGVNNDFGEVMPAPVVTDLQLFGIHHQPSQIVLHVTGALDPAQAANPGRYTLVALGKGETLGAPGNRVVPIASAVYDPAAGTLTLRPVRHINLHYHYVLRLDVPAASTCAPDLVYTAVFGRSAVPVFTKNGVSRPAPTMTPQEVRHDAEVVRQVENYLASHSGLKGWMASETAATTARHAGPRTVAPTARKTSPHHLAAHTHGPMTVAHVSSRKPPGA